MRIATFDVGGTFVKYCLMSDGVMSHQGSVPTLSATQEEFTRMLDGILRELGAVDGIAFSLPAL